MKKKIIEERQQQINDKRGKRPEDASLKPQNGANGKLVILQAAAPVALGMTETGTELPRYRCHKEVRAFKIESVQHEVGIGKPYTLSGYGVQAVVTGGYVRKHEPKPGGYYVLYADGYESYSPAKAFEEGYSLIGSEAPAPPQPAAMALNARIVAELEALAFFVRDYHLVDDLRDDIARAIENRARYIRENPHLPLAVEPLTSQPAD